MCWWWSNLLRHSDRIRKMRTRRRRRRNWFSSLNVLICRSSLRHFFLLLRPLFLFEENDEGTEPERTNKTNETWKLQKKGEEKASSVDLYTHLLHWKKIPNVRGWDACTWSRRKVRIFRCQMSWPRFMISYRKRETPTRRARERGKGMRASEMLDI